MDWTGGSAESEKTVEVAVVKVEATVPVTDPTYGGAVILNPGASSSSSPRCHNFRNADQDPQAALAAPA